MWHAVMSPDLLRIFYYIPSFSNWCHHCSIMFRAQDFPTLPWISQVLRNSLMFRRLPYCSIVFQGGVRVLGVILVNSLLLPLFPSPLLYSLSDWYEWVFTDRPFLCVTTSDSNTFYQIKHLLNSSKTMPQKWRIPSTWDAANPPTP